MCLTVVHQDPEALLVLEITRIKWTRSLTESQLTSTKHPTDPGADPGCSCLLLLQQPLSSSRAENTSPSMKCPWSLSSPTRCLPLYSLAFSALFAHLCAVSSAHCLFPVRPSRKWDSTQELYHLHPFPGHSAALEIPYLNVL